MKVGNEDIPLSTDLDSRVEVEKKPSVKERVMGVVEKIKEKQRINKALEPERRKEKIEKLKMDIEEQKAKNEYSALRKEQQATKPASFMGGFGSFMGSAPAPTRTTKRSKPSKPMDLSTISNFKMDFGGMGNIMGSPKPAKRKNKSSYGMDTNFMFNVPSFGMTPLRGQSKSRVSKRTKQINPLDFKLKLPKFRM
jgi:hypothetical protein